MPPAEKSPALQQLAALADDPRAQADHAAGIVAAAANATGTSNAGASGSGANATGTSGSKASNASGANAAAGNATGTSNAGASGSKASDSKASKASGASATGTSATAANATGTSNAGAGGSGVSGSKASETSATAANAAAANAAAANATGTSNAAAGGSGISGSGASNASGASATGTSAAAANATGTSNAGASGSGISGTGISGTGASGSKASGTSATGTSGSKASKASRASAAGASSAGRYGKDVLSAALAVLAEHPAPQARPDLLRLLAYYGANKGVRDQGGYLRRTLLEALRPIAVRDDAALVAQAAATYEFWPPDFAEDAVMLRGAAIVVLAEIDEELARYHAARLLADPYVQPMSGEPAVSAARVLGALDELRVLWSYVFSDAPGPRSEVIAECLRQLVGLPPGLLPALVERFGTKAPASVQLGLIALLINHHAGPQQRDYLRHLLAESRDADIYRYLVMSMVAAGHEVLVEDLLDSAAGVQERQRLETLIEAFELLGHRPRCAQMAKTLRARLAAAPRSGRPPAARQR